MCCNYVHSDSCCCRTTANHFDRGNWSPEKKELFWITRCTTRCWSRKCGLLHIVCCLSSVFEHHLPITHMLEPNLLDFACFFFQALAERRASLQSKNKALKQFSLIDCVNYVIGCGTGNTSPHRERDLIETWTSSEAVRSFFFASFLKLSDIPIHLLLVSVRLCGDRKISV